MKFIPSILGTLLVVVALLCPERAAWAAADVVISEFMANNGSTLKDEDEEYSDYIELFNAGDAAANLDGWWLTDDPALPEKWRFPAITLAPARFLIVFASDKDRRNPAAPLHTNFKLLDTGDDLILTAADGTTQVFAYLNYPPQEEDFSYGLAMNATLVTLVKAGDPCKTLVPSDGGLGTSWYQPTFNDAGWISGTTGIGYDENPDYLPLIGTNIDAQMNNVRASAFLRVSFNVPDPSLYSSVVLRMKYDDGFSAFLNGTRLDGRNDPNPLLWDSGATTTRDEAQAVQFEEIVMKSSAGLLRAGANVLAVHGLNAGAGSSDFLILPELDGLNTGTIDRGIVQFFHRPTPGSGNLPGFTGLVEKPQFSPPGGTYSSSVSLTLSASTPGAVIRYTLSGSEPTETSTAYTAPISITGSTLVRARIFGGAQSVSPLISAAYVILAADAVSFNSNLPVLVLDNFGGGSVPANNFQPAFLSVFDLGADGRARLNRAPDLETRCGMKIRGSSTQGQPKQNFSVEAWDEKNRDRDIALLDLPAESDWILYAPYNFDRSMLRNPFIMEISNQIGRYAPRTRFVEVFVNRDGGTLLRSEYAGVYVLMEKIKRGPHRVDIERLIPSEIDEPFISGGYMLKIDRLDPGDSGMSAGGQRMGFVYPKEEVISPDQVSWIQTYINDFVSTLNGPGFTDPDSGYAYYIEPDSWIDHHILNVLPMNVDALRLSAYFYKGRERRMEFGPIWDFDRSINSTDGRDDNPSAWKGTGDATDFFGYPWWGRLFQDPDFWQKWRDRWQSLRKTTLSTANVNSTIDSMAAEVAEAQVRNFQVWTSIGGGGGGWQNDVNNMKSWLATRSAWIDSQFTAAPRFSRAGGPITPGFQLTITGTTGTIYYTIDGTDPRASGGGIAPGAKSYAGAIALNANARVVARARVSATNWSGPTAESYFTSLPRLAITEFMYHPLEAGPGSPYSEEDFEFVEIQNVGDEPIALPGVRLTGGISFVVPSAEAVPLQSGEYAVVARNFDAFAARYTLSGRRVIGSYTGNLSNDGDSLGLEGPLGEPIHLFNYSDTWLASTDGEGMSLAVLDPKKDPSTWGDMTGWAASTVLHGTPGEDDPGLTGGGGRQQPGDSNQDGRLDLADAVSLLIRLFLGGSMPMPCEGGALDAGANLILLDVSDDARVDVTDAVFTLNYLFRNGPAPAKGTRCIRIEGCGSACL